MPCALGSHHLRESVSFRAGGRSIRSLAFCFAFTLEFVGPSQRDLPMRFVSSLWHLGTFASVENMYIRCPRVSHLLCRPHVVVECFSDTVYR